jgi:hypothetical protein
MQRTSETGMVFETCPISKSVVKKIRCVGECINHYIFTNSYNNRQPGPHRIACKNL